MVYTTKKELHTSWRNLRPKKALKRWVRGIRQEVARFERRGLSVRIENSRWYVSNPSGTSVDPGAYIISGDPTSHNFDLKGVTKVMEQVTSKDKVLNGIICSVYLTDEDKDKTVGGVLFYSRKLGPNNYEYWDERYERSRRAGIYIELSAKLEKRGDKKELEELVSGRCDSSAEPLCLIPYQVPGLFSPRSSKCF